MQLNLPTSTNLARSAQSDAVEQVEQLFLNRSVKICIVLVVLIRSYLDDICIYIYWSSLVTTQIELRPNEFVKEVKGLVGTYNGWTVIRTLAIVTNITTHGPYGNPRFGPTSPFSIPVAENCSIVGFFGRGKQLVDSLGVYVKEE